MRKIIVFCFLFASLAPAQRQSVVVLPSLADPESGIDPKQLDVLTEDVRSIITKNLLPNKDFNLLKQDEVKERLGDADYFRDCEEGSCVGNFVKKVQANFGARCDVKTVGSQLFLKFELYGTLKGQNEAGTIAQFNEPVKDFADMRDMLKKEVPAMFDNIAKISPASPFIPGGISGLQSADGGYEFSDQKHFLANITTNPEGAVLSFNGFPDNRCARTPCKTELAEGRVRILAVLDQYERADTTVSIKQNNQNISINLKANFGVLDIKPAYLEGVGTNENWNLSLNGKTIYSLANNLSPGKYNAKLWHRCYEDLSFDVGINRNKREVFDMAGYVKLKMGGLVLRAEQDDEPVSEPVFVNGKQVGETPFSSSVPVCSEVKVGDERVNIELEYKQMVSYTYKIPDSEERRQKKEKERARIEEEEEERKMEAKREEAARTAKIAGITIGGGVSMNMNDIDPNYFKSTGGQFNINAESYQRNSKFLRFGMNLDFGAFGVERDEIRRNKPDFVIDSIQTLNMRINAFARLYPVELLFLTGGVGWGLYKIDGIVQVSTPVFPVGGGICLCYSGEGGNGDGLVGFGLVLEGLYNMVPFQGRTASYMSINGGFKLYYRGLTPKQILTT
jgi:hypothetical protein